MDKRFPHLEGATEFPSVRNVDVYKYANENDYSRWDNVQMKMTLCGVPWDLGEAHVGQRVIEGVGNVVDFGSEAARDAWFDSLPDDSCYRFETKYRRFHDAERIELPVPVESIAEYNYVEVIYEDEPGEGAPLEYSNPDGIKRWYYFIRDVSRKASNTTSCTVFLDTWQTCIYRVNIPYMQLKRGHWPVSQTSVNRYLANPAANSEYLIAEDVNFGEPTRAKYTGAALLNDDVLACIATVVNARGDFGTIEEEGWRAPATYTNLTSGAPAPQVFAMAPEALHDFLNNADLQAPQFKQGVRGVFFAPRKLLTIGAAFTLFGTACNIVEPKNATLPVIDLQESMWGYPEQYMELAKLYTWPYSQLAIYTEGGDVDYVRVEDTTGEIDLNAALSITWPWISIDARLKGVGGSGGAGTLTFHNVTAHSFPYSGAWYKKLMTWGVPVYTVVQSANAANFSTYWDRQQQLTAGRNAQANANASAAAEQTNANAGASTEQANANASATAARANENAAADLETTNAAVRTAANTAINARSNQSATDDANLSNALNQAIQAWNAGYTRATTAAEIEGEQQSAAVGAAAGVIGNVASGAMSGGLLGAAAGLVSGAIGGANSMAQAGISANLSSTKAEATISNSQAQVNENNQSNTDRTSNQTSANTDNTSTTNQATTTSAENQAATMVANATRTYNAATGNAARSYSTATANAGRTYETAVANAARDFATVESAVENQQRGAMLGQPLTYGSAAGGETGTTRPMAVFTTVETQSPGAIAQAGDAFLRYGYELSRNIEFTGFNVMPKFSFWQVEDMWLNSSTIPDSYMDQIRMLLFGGVTVWHDPADIGNTSIYENV